MTIKEKNKLRKWANRLTDQELEEEYYKYVFCSLDSQVEEMYEQRDYLTISHILEEICCSRGIKLWE